MGNLIERALSNRVAGNLLLVFFVLAGFAGLNVLNVRVLPPIDLEQISITVPYPGATPQEVETSIVVPIEERLEGLEGVDKLTSLAGSGVANVIIDIRSGEDINEMLDEIKTEVDRITVFPQESEEPQIVELEAEEATVQFVLYGDVSREVLKQTADRVRADLASKDGISLVEISGVPEYLIDIEVDEETLRARALSLTGIARAISQQSLDLSGGEIEDDTQRRQIRAIGERRSGEEFKTVTLGSGATGTPILLGDVAKITDGLSDNPVAAIYKGQPAALVTVFRVGDEQVLALADVAKDYFNTEIKSALPAGVQADIWRDESVELRSRINLLLKNAAIGLGLVVLLLMLFLDLRVAFWAAVGVGVCFIAAFFPMFLFGVTINQLSLFGFILAIGIIVDDAIVVGENVHATVRKGESGTEAARIGTMRVVRPVAFSVTTTIVAFMPILFVPGVFGDFLNQIAAVVIILLVLSLIESFLILPRHLSHLDESAPPWYSPRRLTDPVRDKVAGGLRWFRENPLRSAVEFAVLRPVMVVLLAFGVFAASLGLFTSGTVKFIFFPTIEGEFVTAELELAEGASEVQTRRFAEQIAAKTGEAGEEVSVQETPVQGTLILLGQPTAQSGPDNGGTSGGAAANLAFIYAKLEASDTRDFSASSYERAWRSAVGDIPGASKLTFTSDLVSPGAPIQLQVSSESDETTRQAVIAIRDIIEAQSGVYDARDDRFRTTDEVQLRLKDLARDYGLTQQDLASEVRAAFFGAEATRIQRDREEIEVRVRLPEDARGSLETLKSLRVPVNGGYIPMQSLADISIEPAPAQINRRNGERIYEVSAFVDERINTAGAVIAVVLEERLPELQEEFPGLRVQLAGDQEDQAESQAALGQYYPLALCVIYILLALNFGSYSQPIVVMLAIPFGFCGALIGHALIGLPLSLLSIFGIIGLSGVIINTSLMVTDFLNERLANGETPRAAVVEAMLDRFRAILLTTLTTFLGVTPIIFERSLQAQFLIPTAISLGLGILIGTLLLTLTLPALLMLHLRIFGGGHAKEGPAADEPSIAAPAE